MTLFPAASARVPDLFNLIIINKEIAALEEDILDARYDGLMSVVVSDTVYTDTTIAPTTLLDTAIAGTTLYNATTDSATLPGTTLLYNANSTTFYIEITGTAVIVPTDTPLSVSGNLILGSTTVALTDAMTLAQIVIAINDNTVTTGIRAISLADGANVKLQMVKDNVIENDAFIIGTTSTSTILTELGLTANDAGYVVDLPTAAAQIGSDATVTGAGPYSITLTDATGVYVISGTSMAALGFVPTIDLASDTISITAHGLTTGDQVTFTSVANLPVPINAFPDSLYYVIVVDVDNIRLATSYRNAITSVVLNITQDGTDVFSMKKTSDAEIYYQVANGYKDDPVYKERYDEVIKYFELHGYIIYSPTNTTTNTTFEWKISW